MRRQRFTIRPSCVLASFVLLVSGQASGDTSPLKRLPNVWVLTEEISSRDVVELMTHPNIRVKRPIILELNSEGGDLSAAMKIGRLLRDTRSTVIVREGNVCFSACVLVLAGAAGRIVSHDSDVGIHRPYSTSVDAASYESVRSRYKALEREVRAYLEEMNVPDALFDAMLRVPPEGIRILSNAELSAYGLNSDDPVKAEYDDLQNAREYGVGRTEYLRRKQVAESCNAFFPPETTTKELFNEELETYNRCRESILRTGKWDGR